MTIVIMLAVMLLSACAPLCAMQRFKDATLKNAFAALKVEEVSSQSSDDGQTEDVFAPVRIPQLEREDQSDRRAFKPLSGTRKKKHKAAKRFEQVKATASARDMSYRVGTIVNHGKTKIVVKFSFGSIVFNPGSSSSERFHVTSDEADVKP